MQKIEKCSVAQSKLFRRSLAGNFWNATYFCWDLLYPTKKVWVATFNFFEFSKQVGKGDFSSLSFQRLKQLHSPLDHNIYVIIPFSNLLEKSLTINILLSNMNQKFSISTKLSKIFSFLLTFFMEKLKVTNLNQNFVSRKTVPKFSKTVPLPCLRHESNIYIPLHDGSDSTKIKD